MEKSQKNFLVKNQFELVFRVLWLKYISGETFDLKNKRSTGVLCEFISRFPKEDICALTSKALLLKDIDKPDKRAAHRDRIACQLHGAMMTLKWLLHKGCIPADQAWCLITKISLFCVEKWFANGKPESTGMHGATSLYTLCLCVDNDLNSSPEYCNPNNFKECQNSQIPFLTNSQPSWIVQPNLTYDVTSTYPYIVTYDVTRLSALGYCEAL